jgi:radical SAM superfamily enzyme YgiQ (UPF0313 family)
MKEKILIINPSIHDFAAYNLWARPIGILYIISILRKIGFNIDFIDCLSLEYEELIINNDHKVKKSKSGKYSTYHYYKKEIQKPEPYKKLNRKYFRYGIDPEVLKEILLLKQKPKVILITSIMTYWYKGVFEVIELVKKIFPDVPVILGGIYAILCSNHAKKYSNADIVFDSSNILQLVKLLCDMFEAKELIKKFNSYFKKKDSHELLYIYPALDEYKENKFIPMSTSFGCVYKCKYCAACYIQKKFIERSADHIFEEIKHWAQRYEVKDVGFYDDALLLNKEKRIKPFLKEIVKNNIKVNFHTPNGVHIRAIDEELALLMKESGFNTLRFGFESIVEKFQKDSDNKVTNNDFEKTMNILFKAGFTKENIGIYILMGLPGQTNEDVKKTIRFIKDFDLKPKLCEYSPIPYTEYFKESLRYTKADIYNEPLFQNNTTLSLWSPVFTAELINELKLAVK